MQTTYFLIYYNITISKVHRLYFFMKITFKKILKYYLPIFVIMFIIFKEKYSVTSKYYKHLENIKETFFFK